MDGSLNKVFVVKILNKQNASWQGTVTWTETGKTKPFRSALELMKLIESACAEE